MKWGQLRDFCLLAPRLLLTCLVLLLLLSPPPSARCQEAGSSPSQRAILEIVLYNPVEHGGYVTQSYKLIGMFSIAGTSVSAEGRIIQLHPLGLCNTNDYDELYEYGWVGVVKLERPEFEPEPCLSVFGKAKRAVQRGATAVVFDITDNPVAAEALMETDDRLTRPVILMQGADAAKLMGIVNMQSEARIRIIYSPQESSQESVEISHKEYFGMGIFVAVFLLFCLICIIVMLKLKWRHRERQISHSNLAKRAIAKLETRKYESSCHRQQRLHVHSSAMSVHSSISECCAICLEGYKEGQVLRVMPCYHEFHRLCVDPWLENHGTCPLCKVHIADQMDLEEQEVEEDQEIVHREITAVGATSDARSQSQLSETHGNNSSSHSHQQQPSHQSCSSSRHSLFSASGVGSHRSFISMPFSSHRPEYTPLHLVQSGPVPQCIHTCPSCRGTLGSAPSSTSSNAGTRSDRNTAAAKAIGEEMLHPSEYVNRCTYVREYTDPRRESGTSFVAFQSHHPFIHPTSSHTQVYHTDNPVSVPCSCSFQARSSAVYAHHAARLYIPVDCHSQLSSSKQQEVTTTNTVSAMSMELHQEHQDVRAASATAVHGSCSSDGAVSWECDNCRGLSDSSGTGAECSNRSTYGSSDNKDSSDVSSFDSNIYRGKGSSSSSDEREAFDMPCSSKDFTENKDSFLKSPLLNKSLFPQVSVSHRKNRNLLFDDDFTYRFKKQPLNRRDSSSSPCLSDISAGAWSWDSSNALSSSPVCLDKPEESQDENDSEKKPMISEEVALDDQNLEGAGEALASHNVTNEIKKMYSRSRSASSRPSRTSHERPQRTLSTPAVASPTGAAGRDYSPSNSKSNGINSKCIIENGTSVLKRHTRTGSVFMRRSSLLTSSKDSHKTENKINKNSFVNKPSINNNNNNSNYAHNNSNSNNIDNNNTDDNKHTERTTTVSHSTLRKAHYKISGEAQSTMKDIRKASLTNSSKTPSKGSGRRKQPFSRASPGYSWTMNSHPQNFHYIGQCNVCKRQHVIISSQPPVVRSVEPGISSQTPGPVPAQVARPVAGTLVCQVCHRSTQVPQTNSPKKMAARRSMVLFTEPQGAFITIPLLEKDRFDPANGV